MISFFLYLYKFIHSEKRNFFYIFLDYIEKNFQLVKNLNISFSHRNENSINSLSKWKVAFHQIYILKTNSFTFFMHLNFCISYSLKAFANVLKFLFLFRENVKKIFWYFFFIYFEFKSFR